MNYDSKTVKAFEIQDILKEGKRLTQQEWIELITNNQKTKPAVISKVIDGFFYCKDDCYIKQESEYGQACIIDRSINNASFDSCKFQHMYVSYLEFHKCNFRKCRFWNIHFDTITFEDCTFYECEFLDCKFTGDFIIPYNFFSKLKIVNTSFEIDRLFIFKNRNQYFSENKSNPVVKYINKYQKFVSIDYGIYPFDDPEVLHMIIVEILSSVSRLRICNNSETGHQI